MKKNLGQNIRTEAGSLALPRKSEDSEIFEVSFDSGCTYRGTLQNGAFHGRGRLTFASGNVYTGDFVRGAREGHGDFFYAHTGERYVGQWRANQKEGFGEYRFSNGSVYRGGFKADHKHGRGEKLCAELRYSGTWVAGRKQGLFKYSKPGESLVKIVEYKDNRVVRVKEVSKGTRGSRPLQRLQKKNSRNARKIKSRAAEKGNCGPKQQRQRIRKRNSSRVSRILAARFKCSIDLAEIAEESERGESELSEPRRKPLLFAIQVKSQGRCPRHKRKWRSGVNLIEDTDLDPRIFRFKSESEFETGALRKRKSAAEELAIESTVDGSEESFNKSGSFLC